MNKNVKAVLWVIVAVLVIWLVSVSVGKDGGSAQHVGDNSNNDATIKVGVIAPLTGDGAVYGESAQNVYKIAVDEINAAGGIDGKQIQLVIEDGMCNGAGGSNAAQKLVNVDKVQVIIGGFCSAESIAAVPVATAGKVALFSPASSNPSLTGVSPYFFRNFPSDSSQGAVIAQVAYDSGKRKVAFIQEQTDYSVGIYKAFNDTFTRLGGVVIKEEYAPTVKDFRSQLTKLQSQNPDALFIDANTPAAMEGITQQLIALKWKTSLFTNDIVLGAADVLTKYKAALEGMIGAEFGVDTSNAKFQHVADAYKAKYNTDMPYQSYGQTEYDAVYIVRDAIAAVGYDGTKIAAFGHQITGWKGASGLVTIGSNGDLAAGHKPMVVKDGKPVSYTK